ncbi:MAG TPA: hypothetical protein VJ020_12005 [Anaerolineales bacterium]|nr:hypothetical protein [Anaerolineales bacterium]
MSSVAAQTDSVTSPTIHQREGWELWWRWVLAVTAGELVSFAVPSVVGAMAMGFGFSNLAFLVCIVLAGVGEGAILGSAQWLALRLAIPQMRWHEWTLPTALAAMLAWIIGMTPSTFVDFETVTPATLIVGGGALGILFLLSMGGAQWLALRRYAPRAGWWVLANAVAWPVGVAMPFITLGLVPDGASAAVMIVAGVVGGVLMGIVVGALTGLALVWLLRASHYGGKYANNG